MSKVGQAKVVTANQQRGLLYFLNTSALCEVTKATSYSFTFSNDLCWSSSHGLPSLCVSRNTLCDITKSTDRSAMLTRALTIRMAFENCLILNCSPFPTKFIFHPEVFSLQRATNRGLNALVSGALAIFIGYAAECKTLRMKKNTGIKLWWIGAFFKAVIPAP